MSRWEPLGPGKESYDIFLIMGHVMWYLSCNIFRFQAGLVLALSGVPVSSPAGPSETRASAKERVHVL